MARAPFATKLNHLIGKAWDRGWMAPVPLNSAELLERASEGFTPEDEAGGRSAEDVADFRIRLERLCSSVEAEAQLNNLGRAFAYGQLVRAIRQRFALGALWRKRPELLETRIRPPIIIAGQMRSGTTRIHRLLAADPALAATRFCDSWHPVPERPDIRPIRGALTLLAARKLDPWIDSLHPFGAARADEELGWLASALDHSAYEAQWHIPSFTAFSEARDPAPIYREFARLLRTDAAHHGNQDKPRIIKTPQFAEDVAALIGQFPDARIVVSRRSDEETLKSSVSLVANQMVIQSDSADLERIRSEWVRKLALRSHRMDEALALANCQIAEVHFDALSLDWEREIARIYEALGMRLSAEALASMRKEQKDTAKSPHHLHGGDMARFSND